MSHDKQHSPGFLAIVNDAKTRINEMPASDLPILLKSDLTIKIIDVREESEFAAGHLLGAKHIGKGVIERDIEKLYPDKATPLYLYCGGGFRSALAADNLQKMGYSHVVSIDGGWRALKDIMPTETSKPAEAAQPSADSQAGEDAKAAEPTPALRPSDTPPPLPLRFF